MWHKETCATFFTNMKKIQKILLPIYFILLALIIIVVGYVGIVFALYNRIEDNLSVEVDHKSSTVASKDKTYTIVTQNIGFGAYTQDFTFFMDDGKESRARNKETVIENVNESAKIISSYNPDFVLVQEVDFDSTRSHKVDERELLYKAFPSYSSTFANNYHSAYLMYPILEPIGKSNSGIVTLSNYKMTSSLRRSLPISTSVTKIVDLDRCYSISKVPLEDGKELVLFNVHLSAYGGSDEIREAQMNMLFTDMMKEYEKGNYCVCGGDYNHDFTGTSVKTMNKVITNKQDELGWVQPFPDYLLPKSGISRAMDYTCKEQHPTCRNCDIPYEKGNFVIIVDGFLVSDNVNVEYLENVQLDFKYSDHNPVVMKFSLK